MHWWRHHARTARLRPRRLMAAPAAVLALLAVVAALIGGDERPGWLGWAPAWVLAALAAALAAFTTWLVEPWATRRRAQVDREWTVRDQLGRHLGRGSRLPRLDEMDPLALRVHQAIPALPDDELTVARPGGLSPRLPIWIERERAADVRRWLEQAKVDGGFLLLVGDSSTGKTRLLYEVLREQLADWAVLAPDLGDGDPVNAVAEAASGCHPWLSGLTSSSDFSPVRISPRDPHRSPPARSGGCSMLRHRSSLSAPCGRNTRGNFVPMTRIQRPVGVGRCGRPRRTSSTATGGRSSPCTVSTRTSGDRPPAKRPRIRVWPPLLLTRNSA